MPLITLSVQHRHSLDAARNHLESAVQELTSHFGALVRRVEWSTDRSQVRLEGSGGWITMQVDVHAVHLSADFPGLGRLLGGSVTTRLKAILQRTFQQKLPGGTREAERAHKWHCQLKDN